VADQNKTVANDGDVDAFVAGIEDDNRRIDAQTLLTLMREVTGEAPTMWGSSIEFSYRACERGATLPVSSGSGRPCRPRW